MITCNSVSLTGSLNSTSWSGSLSAHTALHARHFCIQCGLSLDGYSVVPPLMRNHFLLDGREVVPGPLLAYCESLHMSLFVNFGDEGMSRINSRKRNSSGQVSPGLRFLREVVAISVSVSSARKHLFHCVSRV